MDNPDCHSALPRHRVPGLGVRMKPDTWSPTFPRPVSLIINFTLKYLHLNVICNEMHSSAFRCYISFYLNWWQMTMMKTDILIIFFNISQHIYDSQRFFFTCVLIIIILNFSPLCKDGREWEHSMSPKTLNSDWWDPSDSIRHFYGWAVEVMSYGIKSMGRACASPFVLAT